MCLVLGVHGKVIRSRHGRSSQIGRYNRDGMADLVATLVAGVSVDGEVEGTGQSKRTRGVAC